MPVKVKVCPAPAARVTLRGEGALKAMDPAVPSFTRLPRGGETPVAVATEAPRLLTVTSRVTTWPSETAAGERTIEDTVRPTGFCTVTGLELVAGEVWLSDAAVALKTR